MGNDMQEAEVTRDNVFALTIAFYGFLMPPCH